MQITLIPLSSAIKSDINLQGDFVNVGREIPPFDALPADGRSQLSRRHARLFQEQGILYLVDLGSRNGTFVNGVKLGEQPAHLNNGDEVRFGKLAFNLQDQDDNTLYQERVEPPLHLELCAVNSAKNTKILVTDFPCLIGKNEGLMARFCEEEGIDTPFLSRRHAHIYMDQSALFLEDLGSTNGTFINGVRLEEKGHQLRSGDSIKFGNKEVLLFSVKLHEHASDNDKTEFLQTVIEESSSTSDKNSHTILMDKANTFLNIFCDDPEELSGADDDHNNKAKKPKQEKPPSVWRAWAGLFFSRQSSTARQTSPHTRNAVIVAIILLSLIGGYTFLHSDPDSKIRELMANGKYREAAEYSHRFINEGDADVDMFQLATSSAIQWLVPEWEKAIAVQSPEQAQNIVNEARPLFDNNPDMQKICQLLTWATDLESVMIPFVKNPVVEAYGNADQMEKIILTWDASPQRNQLYFGLIAQELPSFKDTQTTLLSHFREIKSKAIYLDAINQLKNALEKNILQQNIERLSELISDFKLKYPVVTGIDKLEQDALIFDKLLIAKRERRYAELADSLRSEEFRTPLFANLAPGVLKQGMPDDDLMALVSSAEEAWASGDLVHAIKLLTDVGQQNGAGIVNEKLEHYDKVISHYEALLDSEGTNGYETKLLALFAIIDQKKDNYFHTQIEPQFQSIRKTILAGIADDVAKANALWSSYKAHGGIKSLMRLDQNITQPFRERAVELAESQRLLTRAIDQAEPFSGAISASDTELFDLINAESARQKEAIEEMRSVLGDSVTSKKMALLDSAGITPGKD